MSVQEIFSSEKRDKDSLFDIHFYMEGSFWRAYEFGLSENASGSGGYIEDISFNHSSSDDVISGGVYFDESESKILFLT